MATLAPDSGEAKRSGSMPHSGSGMTVEKSIVASWKRTPGFTRDADGRVRFAFPDDFTSLAKKRQARLGDKHGKNTDEGRALRGLREIRVRAAPSWNDVPCTLTFFFVRNGEAVDKATRTCARRASVTASP